jgi:hypothetical protein
MQNPELLGLLVSGEHQAQSGPPCNHSEDRGGGGGGGRGERESERGERR